LEVTLQHAIFISANRQAFQKVKCLFSLVFPFSYDTHRVSQGKESDQVFLLDKALDSKLSQNRSTSVAPCVGPYSGKACCLGLYHTLNRHQL
jgi:hypothetical protein